MSCFVFKRYIRGFFILPSFLSIRVYLKFYSNSPVYFKLFLVSLPSKRVYFSLNELSRVYANYSFNYFYILSTSKGLVTSTDCLLCMRIAGEVLLKVHI